MAIKNRVPELLEAKFDGLENINISQLAKELGLVRNTVRSWINDQVVNFNEETLNAWCEYFGLPEGDMLLSYVPDKKQEENND